MKVFSISDHHGAVQFRVLFLGIIISGRKQIIRYRNFKIAVLYLQGYLETKN